MEEIEDSRLEFLKTTPAACHISPHRTTTLAEYIETCATITGQTAGRYWFRGQGSASWSLTPSALRYDTEKRRTEALQAIHSFKRFAVTKLQNVPQAGEELLWIQKARHYGLPTRLLDWTENAAIGLYFACEGVEDEGQKQDGLVFILDPIELNVVVDKERARVFDANRDADQIQPYLEMTGRKTSKGRPSIAIDPVWNSERLVLQKGKFTLHGAGKFALTSKQARSLVGLPVLHEDKEALLAELQTIGIDEMSIFPEPEHVCSYIRRFLGL